MTDLQKRLSQPTVKETEVEIIKVQQKTPLNNFKSTAAKLIYQEFLKGRNVAVHQIQPTKSPSLPSPIPLTSPKLPINTSPPLRTTPPNLQQRPIPLSSISPSKVSRPMPSLVESSISVNQTQARSMPNNRPLINLIMCPICKEALWGVQAYALHLKIKHHIDRNMPDKLPLQRIKIPDKPKKQNWPIRRMPTYKTYAYTSFESRKQMLTKEVTMTPVKSQSVIDNVINHHFDNKKIQVKSTAPESKFADAKFKKPLVTQPPTVRDLTPLQQSVYDRYFRPAPNNLQQMWNNQMIQQSLMQRPSVPVQPQQPPPCPPLVRNNADLLKNKKELPKLVPMISKKTSDEVSKLRLIRPWEAARNRNTPEPDKSEEIEYVPLKKRRLIMYELDSKYS